MGIGPRQQVASRWAAGRVRGQVVRQHRTDGALGLGVRIGRGIHRQSGHVCAHGAVLVGLKDDRLVHGQSTPAFTQDSIARCVQRGATRRLSVHLRPSGYDGQPSRGLPTVAHALVGKRERRLVNETFVSWNHIAEWLRCAEALRAQGA